MLNAHVQAAVRKIAGQNARIKSAKHVPGGSINQTLQITLASGEVFFAKVAKDGVPCPGMFESEAAALNIIAASNTCRVPETLYADQHCLVQTMFRESHKATDWHEQIGHSLARMHQGIQAQQFGFERDNYLGTTPQDNRNAESWLDFWRDRRLEPQIALLFETLDQNDDLLTVLNRLSARLDNYLADCSEPAVFIHGDLWSGNAAADENGSPIIFDPASYFASREAEFGMMRLFGGFGSRTEAAYEEIWPFEPDFETRVELYRLYHIVNHLIIFGRSYYADALAVAKSLL